MLVSGIKSKGAVGVALQPNNKCNVHLRSAACFVLEIDFDILVLLHSAKGQQQLFLSKRDYSVSMSPARTLIFSHVSLWLLNM